jgi:uncharacterized membrane protein (DUF485 family)
MFLECMKDAEKLSILLAFAAFFFHREFIVFINFFSKYLNTALSHNTTKLSYVVCLIKC